MSIQDDINNWLAAYWPDGEPEDPGLIPLIHNGMSNLNDGEYQHLTVAEKAAIGRLTEPFDDTADRDVFFDANPTLLAVGIVVKIALTSTTFKFQKYNGSTWDDQDFGGTGTSDHAALTNLEIELSGHTHDLKTTNSLARSLQGRLSQKVSVLDYIPEAYHDDIMAGVSAIDCSSYIQLMFNDNGEDTIYDFYGTIPYSSTSGLTFLIGSHGANIHLVGHSCTMLLIDADTAGHCAFAFQFVDNFSISGFEFNGNGYRDLEYWSDVVGDFKPKNNRGYLVAHLYLNHIIGLNISNNRFIDFAYLGIYLTYCSKTTITYNTFDQSTLWDNLEYAMWQSERNSVVVGLDDMTISCNTHGGSGGDATWGYSYWIEVQIEIKCVVGGATSPNTFQYRYRYVGAAATSWGSFSGWMGSDGTDTTTIDFSTSAIDFGSLQSDLISFGNSPQIQFGSMSGHTVDDVWCLRWTGQRGTAFKYVGNNDVESADISLAFNQLTKIEGEACSANNLVNLTVSNNRWDYCGASPFFSGGFVRFIFTNNIVNYPREDAFGPGYGTESGHTIICANNIFSNSGGGGLGFKINCDHVYCYNNVIRNICQYNVGTEVFPTDNMSCIGFRNYGLTSAVDGADALTVNNHHYIGNVFIQDDETLLYDVVNSYAIGASHKNTHGTTNTDDPILGTNVSFTDNTFVNILEHYTQPVNTWAIPVIDIGKALNQLPDVSLSHTLPEIYLHDGGDTTNTFLGLGAGNPGGITTGIKNTAEGYGALESITSGINNSAVGQWALQNCTSGSVNMAIGRNALKNLTTGSNNCSIGSGSLVNTNGINNVAIGQSAGAGNTSSTNVFIGVDTGRYSGANYGCVYIGAYSGRHSTLDSIFCVHNSTTGTDGVAITNNATTATGSFMYGVISTTPGASTLTINAGVTCPYTITADGGFDGDGSRLLGIETDVRFNTVVVGGSITSSGTGNNYVPDNAGRYVQLQASPADGTTHLFTGRGFGMTVSSTSANIEGTDGVLVSSLWLDGNIMLVYENVAGVWRMSVLGKHSAADHSDQAATGAQVDTVAATPTSKNTHTHVPYHPIGRLKVAAATQIIDAAADTYTQVMFDFESILDEGITHGTANRLDITDAGVVEVTFNITTKNNAGPTEDFTAVIYQNGIVKGASAVTLNIAAGATDNISNLAPFDLDVAAGDYVEIFVKRVSGDGTLAFRIKVFAGSFLKVKKIG